MLVSRRKLTSIEHRAEQPYLVHFLAKANFQSVSERSCDGTIPDDALELR
jgi:hypothetical protein